MTQRFHHFSDTICPAASSSFLARFDHRTLLIVWGVFIVSLVSIGKFDLIRALSFTAFPLFVIIAGRIPVLIIARRLFFLSPFIVIMAVANPFLDREVLVAAGGIKLTSGMLSAAVIIAKALLALTAMILLDRCISIGGLCNALRRLRVPAVFTTQLLLLHRYAFLIANEAATMLKARDLRSFGRRGRGPLDTANLIGSLLLRSVERSERIYKAMLSRGFTGSLPVGAERHFGGADLFFVTLSVSGFALLRFIF